MLIKLTGNIHYTLLLTWLDAGGQRSRSEQAQVCGGKDIHTDTEASNSSSSYYNAVDKSQQSDKITAVIAVIEHFKQHQSLFSTERQNLI